MIKYNNSNINGWFFDNSDIVKVYKHGAVVFYKFDSEQGGYKVCYAVVDDISQYQETEFDDVFDKATEKWYKLNNLNAYEEYGIYGSGRNITYYDGKLTIDGDYEYEWNGSSWVNIGEVSGSSITIKSPEYIEKNSSHTGYCELLETLTEDTKIIMKHRQTVAAGASIIGDYFNNDNDDWRVFFVSSTLYYDFITQRKSVRKTMPMSAAEEWEIGNYYIKNTATGSYYINGTQQTFSTRPNQMYLYYLGGFGNVSDYGQVYYIKIYRGETLVRDFIPWTDMNGNYGLYDKVENELVHTIGNMTASTVINDVTISSEDYPKYYSEKSEPLDNLTFNTLEEAQAYAEANCVYVGLKATIDGDKYVFSGDSQSGYEWVYNPSRLPVGYTEVEYISSENISEAVLGPYIDTNYKPTQNTRLVIDYQSTSNTRDYQRIFGSGEFDMLGYLVNIEGKIGTSGYYYYKFGQTSSWYTTNVQCDLNRHVIDYNNSRQFLVDNNSIATLPNTTFTCTSNLGIFWSINTKYTTNSINFIGRIFSAKVYDNGTLIRDLVPCINPSNVVGMYDIVNNVFYTSSNNYSFKAGDPV